MLHGERHKFAEVKNDGRVSYIETDLSYKMLPQLSATALLIYHKTYITSVHKPAIHNTFSLSHCQSREVFATSFTHVVCMLD